MRIDWCSGKRRGSFKGPYRSWGCLMQTAVSPSLQMLSIFQFFLVYSERQSWSSPCLRIFYTTLLTYFALVSWLDVDQADLSSIIRNILSRSVMIAVPDQGLPFSMICRCFDRNCRLLIIWHQCCSTGVCVRVPISQQPQCCWSFSMVTWLDVANKAECMLLHSEHAQMHTQTHSKFETVLYCIALAIHFKGIFYNTYMCCTTIMYTPIQLPNWSINIFRRIFSADILRPNMNSTGFGSTRTTHVLIFWGLSNRLP